MNPTQQQEILSKAMQCCSRKEYNSRAMLEKIISWGCVQEDAQSIVNALIEQKFIDDRRYTEAYVKDKLHFNKWGRIKMAYMLRMQGIDETIIRTALNDLEENEYKQILGDELAKKYKTIRSDNITETKGKLFRFAASRGFETDVIYQVVEQIYRFSTR